MSLGWLSIGAAGDISVTKLNVDDGTLYVDETGNKVGVRNLRPEAPFHVNKARTFSGTYSRTGSTVTVTTSAPHGLVSGDIVRMYFLTGAATSGRYRVTVTSTTQFTFTHKESGTAAGSVDVTLEFYYTEDKTYSTAANGKTITITMNTSGVTNHNVTVGNELFFIFYTGFGLSTGDFITGGQSPPPNTSASIDNDYYVNTVNGDIFKKSSGNWNSFKNLQTDSEGGPYTGANTYIVASGNPTSGLGSVNDFYVNKDNGEIWRKTVSGWTKIVSQVGTFITQSWSVSPNPTGYLKCDGRAVSRTTYSELFAVIGTTYGIGDGSSTFDLPNITDQWIKYQPTGLITLKDGTQTIYDGGSEPGNSGDFYMDVSLSSTKGYVYYKSADLWTNIGTVADNSGATGLVNTGLIFGYGAPSSGLGALNNIYVNRSGGDVYQKYLSGWYLAGNVRKIQPLSGVYRISAVSLDSNVLIIDHGWNMNNGFFGNVYFRAPLSDSEREGANGSVIYSSNKYQPSLTGIADYTGNLFVSTSEAYAQNRGGGVSLGGVGSTREQATFARISGVQSLGSDLRNGDMVMETLYENGPEIFMFERMRIKAGGNVGIGTNSPSALLTLDKPSGGNFLLLNGFSYGNGGAGIFFRQEAIGANSYNCSIINHDLGDGSADGISINAYGGVSFCTGSDSRQERVRITSAGNVGIGTTNPLAKTHIWGTTNTGIRISSSSSQSGTSFVAFHASTDGVGTSDEHAGSIISHSDASNDNCRLDFRIGSEQTLIASMKGNGNVGVGTIQPTSRLHVVSTPTLVANPDFNLVPTGCIMMWALGSAPTGWLLCQGQAVSRTEYARLFGVLDINYGQGDGSTTFNLPDLRGRVPLGVNPSSGAENHNPDLSSRALRTTGGAETHTLTIAQMPAHTHEYYSSPDLNGSKVAAGSYPQNDTYVPTISASTGGNQPHPIMQPFIVLNFIIKH